MYNKLFNKSILIGIQKVHYKSSEDFHIYLSTCFSKNT